MALKRERALAGAAVLEAVPGPWGSPSTLIKVLPGRRAAMAGLDKLTGRRAAGSDRSLQMSLGRWYHKQRQVSVIEMIKDRGILLTAAG